MAAKTSQRRRRKDAYPKRGTKDGDVLMGTCDGSGCGIEVRRGDPFIVTQHGLLVCRPCWEKPDTFQGPVTVDLIQKANKILDNNEIEFGPDNPYF
jgi:hypothetical protein